MELERHARAAAVHFDGRDVVGLNHVVDADVPRDGNGYAVNVVQHGALPRPGGAVRYRLKAVAGGAAHRLQPNARRAPQQIGEHARLQLVDLPARQEKSATMFLAGKEAAQHRGRGCVTADHHLRQLDGQLFEHDLHRQCFARSEIEAGDDAGVADALHVDQLNAGVYSHNREAAICVGQRCEVRAHQPYRGIPERSGVHVDDDAFEPS